MNIVIAVDSFKGCMSSKEISNHIEAGIRKYNKNISITKVPMADGGEGTVDALVDCTNGEKVQESVVGPLLDETKATYGILGDKVTAVIEMSAASGLHLIPADKRNPMITTSYGTGQLIKSALDRGCKHIILGIGGSSTNDGGAGMASALGVRFLNADNQVIGYGGGSLGDLCSIDISGIDQRLPSCSIIAACDVTNPLCGLDGSSYVFGPQKGATADMVEILDRNLMHYGMIVEKTMDKPVMNIPGAGAGGGLACGLMAFLNAQLKKGIDIVIEATNLEAKIKTADLVITGEGMIDYQTAYGKTPFGVAQVALKHNVPVIAITGAIGPNAHILFSYGITSIFPIADKPMTLETSMANCGELLENASERLIRLLMIKYTRHTKS